MAGETQRGRLGAASEHEWLTLGQAARYLGVAQSTIRKWSDGGRVPAFYTPGGHRRYRRGDLDAFLERSRSPRRYRSEEHTSELQSRVGIVCRLLLEKKKKNSKSETSQ